jgi:hypothetical protein
MNASSSSAEELCQTLARKLSSQALLVEFTPDVSILTADTLCLPRDLQILLSRFSSRASTSSAVVDQPTSSDDSIVRLS